MLLRNFARWFLMGYYVNTSLADTAPIGYNNAIVNEVTNSNSARTLSVGTQSPSYLGMNVSNGAMSLDIGFDDTSVSLDDYRLADGNYANRKLQIVSQVRNKTIDRVCLSLTLNTQNTSETPVVVKEIGLYVRQSPSSGNMNYWILIARSVLETPVTINPGESYAFTYSIEI